jgi:energy-coupling factor transporter transmembrane protein EcfT
MHGLRHTKLLSTEVTKSGGISRRSHTNNKIKPMIQSTPGKITAGVSLLIFVALVVMLFVTKMFKEAPKFSSIALAMFVVSALLNTFEIDCLVVGNCSIWAWIRTILGVILSSFLIVILVAISVTGLLVGSGVAIEAKEEEPKEA